MEQTCTCENCVALGHLPSAIESILFVAGDGVSVAYLSEKFGVCEGDVLRAIETLKEKYSGESGIHLIKYRKNFQFSTNPKFCPVVGEVLNPIKEKQLTRAALETMAIIAYKQPVTRLEIEEVRGASSDYAVQILLQNNLIEVIGRKDTIGKPLLFATTDEFLKRFELSDIDHLPSYDELIEKIKVIQMGDDLYGTNRQDVV